MSSIGDLSYFEDEWANNLDSPMFALVDPNAFCPTDVFTQQDLQIESYQLARSNNQNYQIENCTTTGSVNIVMQSPLQQQKQHQQHQDPTSNCNIIALPSNQMYHTVVQQKQQDNILIQQYYEPKQVFQIPLQQELTVDRKPTNCVQSISNTINCKQIPLQQQLQLRKALVQRRLDQNKARLEQQPVELPAPVMRKASGKKMTGRERQVELERQEAEQQELQEHLKSQINILENKCEQLRDILINIVTTSPQFNDEMIKHLEESNLLITQNNEDTGDGALCIDYPANENLSITQEPSERT